jgi:hypothetical protein
MPIHQKLQIIINRRAAITRRNINDFKSAMIYQCCHDSILLLTNSLPTAALFQPNVAVTN